MLLKWKLSVTKSKAIKSSDNINKNMAKSTILYKTLKNLSLVTSDSNIGTAVTELLYTPVGFLIFFYRSVYTALKYNFWN